MIEYEAMSQRTKHIDIKYRFIQDEQKKGTIQLQYVPSEDNLADIFTKPLAINKFRKLRDLFMIEARTAEEGVENAGAASSMSVVALTAVPDCVTPKGHGSVF